MEVYWKEEGQQHRLTTGSQRRAYSQSRRPRRDGSRTRWCHPYHFLLSTRDSSSFRSGSVPTFQLFPSPHEQVSTFFALWSPFASRHSRRYRSFLSSWIRPRQASFRFCRGAQELDPLHRDDDERQTTTSSQDVDRFHGTSSTPSSCRFASFNLDHASQLWSTSCTLGEGDQRRHGSERRSESNGRLDAHDDPSDC